MADPTITPRDSEPLAPLTAGHLRALLASVPDDSEIAAFVEGDTRGRLVSIDEGFNHSEAIFWLRVHTNEENQ
jgi:hypothetical protein